MREDLKEEQSSLFRGKGKKAVWTHKFVCLASTEADRVPTGHTEKMLLEEAGLWEKVITINLDSELEEFRSTLHAAYPKLRDGGGFELMRCLPNSRELSVIGPKMSSSPRLLKRRVGNGRVYIRPIQRDLSLEEEGEEEKVVSIPGMRVATK